MSSNIFCIEGSLPSTRRDVARAGDGAASRSSYREKQSALIKARGWRNREYRDKARN